MAVILLHWLGLPGVGYYFREYQVLEGHSGLNGMEDRCTIFSEDHQINNDNNNKINNMIAIFYWVCGVFFLVFLATPHSMRDLSSQTRDWTCAPCSRSTES